MAEFSIQDAAFTGFRIVRENRRSLPIWAAIALVTSFVFTCVLIIIAGPVVPTLQALSASSAPDPTAVVAVLGRLAPLYFVMIPASIVFYGVLCSAMNRAVLRPEEHKVAYFALGPDEFRQVCLFTLGFVLFGLIYMISVIALVILASVVGSVAHVPPKALAPLAVFSAAFFMTWLGVRFSLASALTFQRRRITLRDSWTLTRGRFWRIFGTYLLVFALGAVIFLLTWLVIVAVVTIATGGNVSAAFAPADLRSIGHYFSAAQLVQLVLQAGVSALMWPVLLAPPADILRQISLAEGASHVRGFA